MLLHRGVVGIQGKAQLVDVVAVFDDILQTDAGIHFSGLSGGTAFAVVRHGDDCGNLVKRPSRESCSFDRNLCQRGRVQTKILLVRAKQTSQTARLDAIHEWARGIKERPGLRLNE